MKTLGGTSGGTSHPLKGVWRPQGERRHTPGDLGRLSAGEWFVLRAGKTLALADDLRAAGLEAWTPRYRIASRRPIGRSRTAREVALLPGYVFVRFWHLASLTHLTCRWPERFPEFKVLRLNGGVPLVADDELASLRDHEAGARNAPRKVTQAFRRGERVRVPEGAFAGLSGLVETVQGNYALVSFPDYHKPIKIARLLLEPEMPQGPKQGRRLVA